MINYSVTCDSTNNSDNDKENNILNVDIKIDFLPPHYNGVDAYTIRNDGFTIQDEIPDCAIYKNGSFDWIDLKLEIHEEDNK